MVVGFIVVGMFIYYYFCLDACLVLMFLDGDDRGIFVA